MFRLSRHGGITSVAAVVAALVSGCGSDAYETAAVRGTVLCNGKPAAGGIISFEPVDVPKETGRPAGMPGRVSRGQVQQDGTFVLKLDPRGADPGGKGAVVGAHRVYFSLPITEPVKVDAADRSLPPEELKALEEELAQIPVYEPLECGTEITPQEVEVTSGTNEFEFTLQPGAPPKKKPAGPARTTGSD